jgi:glycosyltransferase involved in cell wall biosynthesis
MIPTYKGTRYLSKTLASVLAQAPAADEMQIEVIDDGSPDTRAQQLVSEIAGDRVSFFRKPRNEGLLANFNTCIERARGELVHILHDDDAVLPGFYTTANAVLVKDPSLGALFCRFILIDGHERWREVSPLLCQTSRKLDNPALQLARRNLIRTPCVVVRRSVYEQIGGFDSRLSHSADWEMWVRIAVHFGVWYEDRPLALYREHIGSDSSSLVRSGENLRQALAAIRIFYEYLPQDIRSGCRGLGHAWAAIMGWNNARQLLREGDWISALRVSFEAVRCLPMPSDAARGYRLEAGIRNAFRADAIRLKNASR